VAPGIQVDAPSDNEDDDEGDMRDLLERFAEEAGHQGDGRAVPTRRSFEDLRDLNEAEAEAEGEGDDDDDRSYYPLEEARGRKTSTSTSVFSHASVWVEGDRTSRGSFLDGERSEEARQRFLRRVTAMFDESGREKDAVPPVPKLPPGVANQRWGRF
jgi:hypothetical protein